MTKITCNSFLLCMCNTDASFRGHFQTIFLKIKVIMTLGGGVRVMMLILAWTLIIPF